MTEEPDYYDVLEEVKQSFLADVRQSYHRHLRRIRAGFEGRQGEDDFTMQTQEALSLYSPWMSEAPPLGTGEVIIRDDEGFVLTKAVGKLNLRGHTYDLVASLTNPLVLYARRKDGPSIEVDLRPGFTESVTEYLLAKEDDLAARAT